HHENFLVELRIRGDLPDNLTKPPWPRYCVYEQIRGCHSVEPTIQKSRFPLFWEPDRRVRPTDMFADRSFGMGLRTCGRGAPWAVLLLTALFLVTGASAAVALPVPLTPARLAASATGPTAIKVTWSWRTDATS